MTTNIAPTGYVGRHRAPAKVRRQYDLGGFIVRATLVCMAFGITGPGLIVAAFIGQNGL